MKHLFVYTLFLIAGSTLVAAEEALPAPSLPPSTPSPTQQLQSYTSIDPKSRALDYAQAFEMLRKEKTTAKVFFKTKSGEIIFNIIDVTLMNHGTVLFFRFNSSQGIKYQVVAIEEIASIGHF